MRRHLLFSLLAMSLSVPAVFAAGPADADQASAVPPVATLAAAGADAEAGPQITPRLIIPAGVDPARMSASAAQDTPFARPVPPQIRRGFDARRPLLFSLYGMSAGLQAYDGYTTLTALQRFEGSYELNPAMKNIVQQPGKFLAMKAGTAAASIAISEMLWQRNHKVLSIASMLISNSIMATVAAHNTKVISQLEQR
ncbi:MAG: DUF5658 family protein [Vicinamibacterales bacterium]